MMTKLMISNMVTMMMNMIFMMTMMMMKMNMVFMMTMTMMMMMTEWVGMARKSVRVIYRYRSGLLDRVPLSGDDDGDTDGPHGDDVVVEFEVLVYTSEEWNMEKCMLLMMMERMRDDGDDFRQRVV